MSTIEIEIPASTDIYIFIYIYIYICDRTWEKGPLRAQYDFSVLAFLVYLT